MNIFYTDTDPVVAAQSLPDRHIVKMPVEAVQMLVSACVRNGMQPNVMTKKGTIHKGGYHKHPCTVWAGDSAENAQWLWDWGMALCEEYTKRYGKTHFAQGQLVTLLTLYTTNCLLLVSLLLLRQCLMSARMLTLSSHTAIASNIN